MICKQDVNTIVSTTDTTNLADIAKIDTALTTWFILNNESYIGNQGLLSKVRFNANTINCKFYVVVLEKVVGGYKQNGHNLFQQQMSA